MRTCLNYNVKKEYVERTCNIRSYFGSGLRGSEIREKAQKYIMGRKSSRLTIKLYCDNPHLRLFT